MFHQKKSKNYKNFIKQLKKCKEYKKKIKNQNSKKIQNKVIPNKNIKFGNATTITTKYEIEDEMVKLKGQIKFFTNWKGHKRKEWNKDGVRIQYTTLRTIPQWLSSYTFQNS